MKLPRPGVVAGLALLASLLASIAGHTPPVALADGDPASDILLFSDVSLPYSQPVSDVEKNRLLDVAAKAKRAHYPIKAAIIASALDLGSDDRFTGHPSGYARFLSSELASPQSYGKHKRRAVRAADIKVPILIVMPDGIALARRGKSLSTAAVGTIQVPNRPGADPLAEQAVVAIKRLAARAGHPLRGIGPAPPATTSGPGLTVPAQSASSSSDDSSLSGWAIAGIVAIVLVALAAIFVAVTRVSRRRRRRPLKRLVALGALLVSGLLALGCVSGGGGRNRAGDETLDRPVPHIGRGPGYELRPAGRQAARGRPVAGLRCEQGRHKDHYGTHLEVFAKGLDVVIPAGIGIAPPRSREGAYVKGGRCEYPLRTYEPTGLIEIDSGTRATLGQFFDLWGQPLDRNRLLGFRAPRRGSVSAFVNGRRWTGDPRAIPLGRHAAIVLEVRGYFPPTRRYLFPDGL